MGDGITTSAGGLGRYRPSRGLAPGDDRNTTTPRAMAGTLNRFVLGNILSPPSRLRLKSWLTGSVTGLHRLRAGLPRRWVVGDKTGNNRADAAGDIAIAWPDPKTPVNICAYTRGGTPSEPQLDALFATIARLAAQTLV